MSLGRGRRMAPSPILGRGTGGSVSGKRSPDGTASHIEEGSCRECLWEEVAGWHRLPHRAMHHTGAGPVTCSRMTICILRGNDSC